MVALVFALLYAHLKPFASDELDTFANIMQAVLFLNLFVVLVMNSDNSAEQAKMRTGISHAILGGLLIVANTPARGRGGARRAERRGRGREPRVPPGAGPELLRQGGDEAKGGDAGDEATQRRRRAAARSSCSATRAARTVAPTEGRRFIHAAQGWDDHFEESP
ncbi:oxidoreductase [Aureococcus anophagefferens]|nr:oxidoreductase [Aureococcus anophagefferens]